MVEFYSTGINRIIYKSENFVIGKSVTMYVFDPTLSKSGLQNFNEIESGLYYIDYNFPVEGIYIGLFFENGIVKTFNTFRVIKLAKQTDLERLLGLSHENVFIDQTNYDSNNNLISARLRIYSASNLVGTDNGVIAVYRITAGGSETNKFTYWKQQKE